MFPTSPQKNKFYIYNDFFLLFYKKENFTHTFVADFSNATSIIKNKIEKSRKNSKPFVWRYFYHYILSESLSHIFLDNKLNYDCFSEGIVQEVDSISFLQSM